MEKMHLNHSIKLSDKNFVVLCKLECGKSLGAHYHCPLCDYNCKNMQRLPGHFENHRPISSVSKSIMCSESISVSRESCVLVDNSKGIYMVSKNTTGVNVPIHVVKDASSVQLKSSCSEEVCVSSMTAAVTHGTNNFVCKHLEMVRAVSYEADLWHHQDICLSVLTPKEIKLLGSKLENIKKLQTSPVVYWKANDSVSYFSVFTINDESWTSQFGRTLVSFNYRNNKYICACRHSSKTSNCIHIVMTKLYQSVKTPEVLKLQSLEQLEEFEDPDMDTLQPQLQVGLTEFELKYQMENKLHPVIFPSNVAGKKHNELLEIKELVPPETHCHTCSSMLTKKICLTKIGRIVDMKFIYNNVHIFYKRCVECSINYYYKEWNEGVHVGTNRVVLTFDLCLHIRESLRQSTAVGRSAATILNNLEAQYGHVPISVAEIRATYTDFEVHSAHPYEFHCNVCGVYPVVLMTDTCRKGFFNLPVNIFSQFDDSPKIMKNFWDEVSKCIILKNNPTELVKMWAPWITPQNVKEHTESSETTRGIATKISFDDAVMYTEEEIIDAFKGKDKVSLVAYLKEEFNITAHPSESKASIINKIIGHIFTTEAMQKKLTSIFGGSGGWLAMTCTHGVVYALKILIKHESPNDYVDILLSMKHPPPILICDMPDKVSKALAKRNSNMLQPYLGMLAAPTPTNLERAEKGTLKINLPFLDTKIPTASSVNEHSNRHPITGTSKVFIVYDEFHKANSKKKSETMRHIGLLTNLKQINTQVSEQLNRRIGRDHYFLDRMSVCNHLFYMRLVIDLQNKSRNLYNVKQRHLNFKGEAKLQTDKFGRLFHVVPNKIISARQSKTSQKTMITENEANCSITLPPSTTTLLSSTTTLPPSTTTLPPSTTTLPPSPTTLPPSKRTAPITNWPICFNLSLDNALDDIFDCPNISSTKSNSKLNLSESNAGLFQLFGTPSEKNSVSTNSSNMNSLSSPKFSFKRIDAKSNIVSSTPINCNTSTSNVTRQNFRQDQYLVQAIEQCLVKQNFLLYEINEIKITVNDMTTSIPPKYLNDKFIDVSLALLTNNYANSQHINACVFMYFMDTYNADISSDVKFDLNKELIFIPWCSNQHWRLITVFPQKT
jgi:hypothetical protein